MSGSGHRAMFLLHVRRRNAVRVHVRLEVMHPLYVGHNLHAELFGQVLLRYRAARHPADGLARAGASAAHPVPNPVLRLVRIVRVGRPVLQPHLFVVAASRVAVPDDDLYRSPQRQPLEHAGQNLRLVALPSLSRNHALPRPPSVQFALNIPFLQRELRRTAVHRHTHSLPVRFSPGRNPEHLSKRITHLKLQKAMLTIPIIPPRYRHFPLSRESTHPQVCYHQTALESESGAELTTGLG